MLDAVRMCAFARAGPAEMETVGTDKGRPVCFVH